MASYYIDTCALKWRYLNGRPTCVVNQLMDEAQNKVFTSELTILEWSSALASVCREGHLDYRTFKTNELALMQDIATGTLMILPMTRSVERARYFIEYIGIIRKRALRTGDSIQLVTALDAASVARDVITLVTCDSALASIVQGLGPLLPSISSWLLSP